MNKCYPTKEIKTAWLAEVCPDRSIGGIKNIIGIEVMHDNERLLFSIFDDCFFRVASLVEQSLESAGVKAGHIYAMVYHSPAEGMKLYNITKRENLTKDEIFALKQHIFGHYSDLDYDVSMDSDVNYLIPEAIKGNIIDTVADYVTIKGRPITFNTTHIYGPGKCKKRGSVTDGI